ncbi:MAG: Lrp/AsnC family transcriptional regulator [Eubacterium sp.]|nr:Lrp/AsnC family transcriptional regulator [Eubacterium sp.]
MDKLDMKILNSLKKNARLTSSAISEEVGLSVSAVIERIKKMENTGLIKGYTIDIDQNKVGNSTVALMDVSLKHPDYYSSFVELIKKNNNIAACYYQTGEFDFVLKIVTDSTDGLDDVYRDVKGFEGVEKTETHIVLRTLKEEVALLPEE